MLALLFPGQGAQTVGMGGGLTQRSSLAQQLFEQASEILGYDLLKLCLEGPEDQLSRTEFSQPALFVHSFAAVKQLEIERPDLWDQVQAVAGLSLGEYSAIAAAGGLGFEDGVRLVQVRGRAMQAAAETAQSGMSSILGLDLEALEKVCEAATESDASFVQVANLLCPGNIAISGHLDAVERAEQLALDGGAMKAVRLQVAGAFHTPIMQTAVEELTAALSNATFSNTRVPVYTNVDAEQHSNAQDFPTILPPQVVSRVLWEQSLRNLLGQDIESAIEVGSGRVLAGTLKRIDRKFKCENFGD